VLAIVFVHKRNELIKEKLKITPVAEYLQQYKRNRLQHLIEWNIPDHQDKYFTTSPKEDGQKGHIQRDARKT
jgi:hypothetical protein